MHVMSPTLAASPLAAIRAAAATPHPCMGRTRSYDAGSGAVFSANCTAARLRRDSRAILSKFCMLISGPERGPSGKRPSTRTGS